MRIREKSFSPCKKTDAFTFVSFNKVPKLA